MARPTILVVDDEPALCRFVAASLSSRGFDVVTANNGPDALEAYRHSAFDAVLLDVRMMEMDGPTVLQELQKIDPAVRCCFMSGFAGGYQVGDLLARGALAFLPKPFSVKQVEEVVANLLAAPAAARNG